MKESEIQRSIMKYLELVPNIYFFRAGSGAIKTPGGYFRSGRPGCPDIVVCYRGYFVGLEVKTDKGKQSDNQKEAEQKIDNARGRYFIVRSVDDVIEIFK